MAEKSSTSLQWTSPNATGIISLQLSPTPLPITPLAPDEIALDLHAASLNYRDLVIIKNSFPPPWSAGLRPHLIPGSDGAGIITSVGSNVTTFKSGDRVVTHMTPSLPSNQYPSFPDICAGLGQGMDGTLRQHGRFPSSAVLHAPKNLSFSETATLTCSGLTAWNALFGLRGREVQKADWILVQGTGGVSIAALQFAVAVGAHVVATTSNAQKTARLKELGAEEVINYREIPEWGVEAKKRTPSARGFDFIVDIGGDATLSESLNAIRIDGIIIAAGMIGGAVEKPVPMMAALSTICIVRGVFLGTREQFEALVQFVEEKGVRPAVEGREFGIEEGREALEMLERGQHFSKVVVKLR